LLTSVQVWFVLLSCQSFVAVAAKIAIEPSVSIALKKPRQGPGSAAL
jgi:hypothetical protein